MTNRTHIRVSKDTRDKLNVLRDDVMRKESVDDVIVSLMISREYNNAFFERRREEFLEVAE